MHNENLIIFASSEEAFYFGAKENRLILLNSTFIRLYVVFQNRVYDLTNFQYIHSGGYHRILQFNGKCVDNVNLEMMLYYIGAL